MYKKYSLKGKRVWVAGDRGMVGAALLKRLTSEDCTVICPDRRSLDLRSQAETHNWIATHKPNVIFVAAAKVGGILANSTFPADFLYDNLMIEANIIHGAYMAGVEKLVFLGSSCIYPKFASQPIHEDKLLTGMLEPTNEYYAIAKIAGVKLCEAYRTQYDVDYISAMPTNLYGPNDNFDLSSSHVLPALIRKTHEAKQRGDTEVVIWGSGSPRREFLHVDDCADALVFLATYYSGDSHINVGSGKDISIIDLAKIVAEIVGFKGRIAHDLNRPDGTPRKLMSAEKLRGLGWTPEVDLQAGIKSVYDWFLQVHA